MCQQEYGLVEKLNSKGRLLLIVGKREDLFENLHDRLKVAGDLQGGSHLAPSCEAIYLELLLIKRVMAQGK